MHDMKAQTDELTSPLGVMPELSFYIVKNKKTI